jgi:DNA-binding protein HU-beta
LNREELVYRVLEKTLIGKKESEKAVTAVMESISEALAKGDKVQLVGFGTFEVRTRKEREGRNPKTGEKITIKATKVPAFKAGKALREQVK